MMHSTQKKGFALLIAVMIASVLLSMTMVMFSISIKQLTLSTTGRESQYALYSADTALECAIYWDYHGENLFGIPVISDPESGAFTGIDLPTQDPVVFECVGQTISIPRDAMVDLGSSIVVNFDLIVTPFVGRSTIANISVTKQVESPTKIKTTIEARGHNVDNLTSPFAVERGLEVNY